MKNGSERKKKGKFRRYEQTLEGLGELKEELGLRGKPITDRVVVPGSLATDDRPEGAILPVYRQSECGTGEGGSEKGLFNIVSLTGVDPRSSRYGGKKRK